ncbi:acyl-CoA dehydrogenase family protein [Saccharopolyspora sp. HNM0983]|uniref:Acyl-CoA dehydrogenase family protein n=1 Tax=Saccharopolyspora montiporae TaxID=2781240 RepID=A0A929G158_9PSEU|nr:acyl-CoA dehydrogenase family protein [Saccharopolyspora sp. HNM0983]MBE9375984.1 acyl-CoA dehydrogenase family protein [Saccharopolyspora sp. HNM0983]
MQLVLDPEQQQLRDSVRALLADHAGSARVREVVDGEQTWDRRLWRRLAAEQELTGLAVPAEHGGSGAGQVERSVLLEELGRSVAPVPFLASGVFATDVLLALDEPDPALLAALTAGEQVAAVVVADDTGRWGSSAQQVRATREESGWQLTGSAAPVLSGDAADVVLVYAATAEGAGWFAVSASDLGCTRLRTLDPTRGMARLDFRASPAQALHTADPAAVLAAARDRAAVAVSAEQVGVMDRMLEMTVDYARLRVQFGRPIGSYQAVKHACADMHSACEQARAVLRYAAWTADHDPDRLPEAAALSRTCTAAEAFRTAATGLQLHGGIGYTWEHDAHLFYKRAKTCELLLGSGADAAVGQPS